MATCLPECHLDSLKDILSDNDEEEDAEFTAAPVENFTFPNSETCWVCNGYYGPNFDEPLCGTCHSFLYPTSPAEELVTTLSDDEDSGNDEPPFTAADKEKQEIDDDANDDDVDEVDDDPDDAEVIDDADDEVGGGVALNPADKPIAADENIPQLSSDNDK